MADETISFEIDANTRPAIKTLQDFKRTVATAFKGMSDVEIGKNLKDDIKKTKDELKETTKQANTLNKELDKRASGKNTVAEEQQLQSEIKTTTADIKEAQKAYDKLLKSKAGKQFLAAKADVDAYTQAIVESVNKAEAVLDKPFDEAESYKKAAETKERLEEQVKEIKAAGITQEKVTAAFEEYKKAVEEVVKLEEEAKSHVREKTSETDVAYGRKSELKEVKKGKDGKPPVYEYEHTDLYISKEEYDNIKEAEAHMQNLGQYANELEASLNRLRQYDFAQDYMNKVGANPKLLDEYKLGVQEANAQTILLKNANNQLSELGAPFEEANARIQELTQRQTELNQALDSLRTSNTRELEENIEETNYQAEELQDRLDELEDQLENLGKGGKKGGNLLLRIFKKLGKFISMISNMYERMILRTVFYQTIGKSIRSTIDYLKQAVLTDKELSKSVSILKGNMLTSFQLIYQTLRPIILSIIKLLTWLTGVISKVIALLSGKSVQAAQKSAKALYNLSNGTKKAGKEAKKTLASFDELIQIGDKSKDGDSTDTGVTPVFQDDEATDEPAENIKQALEAIRGILIGIGVIIAGWKLIQFLNSVLQLLGQVALTLVKGFGSNGPFATAAGLMLIILGVIALIKEYSDAWVNGLNWENFIGVLGGLALIVAGVGLAFGAAAMYIALVGAGIAAVVLGIHDMIKSGPNLKNQLMMFIGLLAIVIGLILSGHAALGLVIGAIGLAVLVVGNFGDQWSNIMEHVKQITDGFVNLVVDLINGDFDKAWKDAGEIVRGFANLGIDLFEGLVKAAAKALNRVIQLINDHLQFTIPDWVPLFGGKELKANIPLIPTEWSLPRLAEGAVIPPNKEFLAMLGDQKHGTNIETPLSTMIEAFNNALDARDNGSGQNIVIRFEGSLAQLARVLEPHITSETNRQGKNGLIVGGIY